MFAIGRFSRKLSPLSGSVASLVFYASWDFRYVFLLSASILVNYGAGCTDGFPPAPEAASSPRVTSSSPPSPRRPPRLLPSTDFFLSSANHLFSAQFPLLHIRPSPLGISFFTFTQLAFLVDVHRGLAREYNFIHYVLFVTYFPTSSPAPSCITSR